MVEVKSRGLYRRRYGFYATYLFIVCCGMGLSLYLITASSGLVFQICNAMFLSVMMIQAGMLVHDFSHSQVFESEKFNRFFAMILMGLFAGLSESAWFKQHNTHHKYVNQSGNDPDIDIPFIFSEKQRPDDYSFHPHLVAYQHILFFISLPLWYGSRVYMTWREVCRNFSYRQAAEIALAAIHFSVLLYLVFAYLSWPIALAFLFVHVAASGIYLSFIFAPNHKGEEVIGAYEVLHWKNQITSTRNLRPSLVAFYVFGGLNYQIEHHLFTSMPRINYRKVRPLVQRFCSDNGIPYHETTWLESMRQIYRALREQARSRAS